jgi:hypothetical protein
MRAEYRQETPTPAFWAGGLDDPGFSGIEGRSKGGKGKDRSYKGGGDGGGDQDWRPSKPWGKGQKGDGKKGQKGDGQKGAKNNDDQRGDGRYFTSSNGTQICFSYSRCKDGCKKICSFNRAHVCEFCRQPHRTVDCPKHVGWQPPAEAAKKGK